MPPPPPAASRRHTGHKRKGTASAHLAVPSKREENSQISVPSAQHVVPRTSEENSPIVSAPNQNKIALQRSQLRQGANFSQRGEAMQMHGY